MSTLPARFATHSTDITGKVICLGDIVDYDFEGDDPCPFEVVFELNAFRKKYLSGWDETLPKPLLEIGYMAKQMRLLIKTQTKEEYEISKRNRKATRRRRQAGKQSDTGKDGNKIIRS